MASAEEALDLWYRALGSPIGIQVSVNKYDGAKSKLYYVRSAHGDPELADLMIRPCPNDPTGALWIVKKKFNRSELRPAEDGLLDEVDLG